ncbi:MAG: nucleoside-diphosphate sugar epimerase/dehydratase, partial [Sphaerochaeta sp.]
MQELVKNRVVRWVFLMVVDAVLLLASSFLAAWVVFGSFPYAFDSVIYLNIIAIIVVLFAVRFYRIRISESSLDLLSRGLAGFVPVFILGSGIIGFYLGFATSWIPYLIVADGFGFLFVMGVRIWYRSMLYRLNKQNNASLPRAVIYGAGELGSTLVRQYQKGKLGYHVVGFVDDDPKLLHSLVLGVKVCGTVDDLGRVLEGLRAKTLIIAITQISQDQMLSAVDAAKEAGCDIKVIPSLFEMQQQGAKELDLRSLDYADLLGRPLIAIDKEP